MSTNSSAIAIGPREVIQGLAAFGVDIVDTVNKTVALETIREARARTAANADPVAVIFITESLVSSLDSVEYQTLLSNELPVVLTIPDLFSDPNAGLEKLRSLTKRAIGTDIFSNS